MAMATVDPRLRAGDQILIGLFEQAVREGASVGVCDCGLPLTGSVDRRRRVTWYTLECQCGREVTCPNGRINASPVPASGARPVVRPADREAWAEHDRAILGERDDELEPVAA